MGRYGLNAVACGIRPRYRGSVGRPSPIVARYISLLELEALLGEEPHTGIYHLRIVEDSLIPFDLLQGLVYAGSWPVGAVRRHGLNNIGYGQYPRFHEDVLAR